MTVQTIRELAERVRSIPLQRVLLMMDAVQDRRDKAKWHTVQGVISVTGMKFMNWTSGVGGGGAIDLMIHLKHIDFKDAVAQLFTHVSSVPFSDLVQPKPTKLMLNLPLPNVDNLPLVKHYLVRERGLSPSVIESLIQTGKLYADVKSNAVFLLLGKKRRCAGAELRGTRQCSWHGMAPGSQKDFGYFSIHAAASKGIILCESAIDALSCFSIHPHYHCISTSGARSNPPWLAALIQLDCRVYCGFDADATGDRMALEMMTRYPRIKRLRPARKDWNDVLRSNSK